MNINPKIIDHTNLKPEATEKDIEKLCGEAEEYGFGAVCVYPKFVSLCKKLLNKTPVKVCTVIGFPKGTESTDQKAKETEKAIQDGADELDMVINIRALKKKDYGIVENDIAVVKNAAKGKIVKVIIEAGVLNDGQKRKACQLAEKAGANFIKTSTGFVKDEEGKILGATLSDVKFIKCIIGNKMMIKASGSIKTADFAEDLVDAGANRIGASASIKILKILSGEERNSKQKYAWKWFEFHADQRLRAFYYYLIIIGALSWGYLSNENSTGRLIAFLSAIMSIAFLMLEIRNANLINLGRKELRRLEFTPSVNDYNAYKIHKGLLNHLISHEFWLRFIYLLIFFISLDRSDYISKIWTDLNLGWPSLFSSPYFKISILYLAGPAFLSLCTIRRQWKCFFIKSVSYFPAWLQHFFS